MRITGGADRLENVAILKSQYRVVFFSFQFAIPTKCYENTTTGCLKFVLQTSFPRQQTRHAYYDFRRWERLYAKPFIITISRSTTCKQMSHVMWKDGFGVKLNRPTNQTEQSEKGLFPVCWKTLIFSGHVILALLTIQAKTAKIKLRQNSISINVHVYSVAYIWKYECAKIKMRKQGLPLKTQKKVNAPDIKCFTVFVHSSLSNYPASGQRRPWSDCANAQSDQGLHCPHIHLMYIFS